ncbi:MAG: protein kinase [Gemmataceae bacterium]
MTPCPSDQQLEFMVDELLDEGERACVESHVDDCPACIQRLEKIVTTITCPSDQQLESMVDELLDEGERALVENHVDDCPVCIQRLEKIVSTPRLYLPSSSGSSKEGTLRLNSNSDNGERAAPPVHAVREGLPDVPGHELLGELGVGGMGIVYKARQRKLNRVVAIKMLRSLDRNINESERFKLEVEAVAQLKHPNIVQVYEVGEHHGLPFFSMEYVEGGRLEDLAGRPHPAGIAAEIVEILARAIYEAHRRDIVHRDLKPANILLQRAADDENSFGTPKISDFGLVKRVATDSGLTQTGLILGTPTYMSPEQSKGSNVGPATDIWALGIILYELLTGRPPFLGGDAMNTLNLVNNADPVPPRKLQPRLPRDLETICLKCLEKDPERRYPTARHLAEDLSRFRNGETIMARRASLRERGWKWARRRPGVAASLAFCLLTTTALVSGATYHTLQARAEEQREATRLDKVKTESQGELMEGQRLLAQRDWNNAQVTLSSLCTRLEGEPRLSELLGEAQKLLERAQRGADDRRRFAEFRRARAEAMFYDIQVSGLDAQHNVRGTRQAASTALKVFKQPATWELAPLPAALTPAEQGEVKNGFYEMLLVLAGALSQPLPGEKPDAQARAGLKLLDRAALLRPPTQAYHLYRSACLQRQGDSEGAMLALAEAQRLPPTSAFDHFLVGLELCKRLQVAAASQQFEYVLQQEPGHFWARCLLAICHLRDKKPEPARVALTACIEREPSFVWLYLLRGFAASEQGARKLAQASANPLGAVQAVALFEAAEADYRRVLQMNPDEDLRYILLLNRGTMRFQRQALAGAEADFLEAIQLKPEQFNAYASLAQVRKQQDQLEEAARQLTRAIKLEPELAALYRTRAYLYLDHPDRLSPTQRDAVLADLAAAIRLEVSSSGSIAEDQVRRGMLLHLDKRYQDALEAYDAAIEVVPAHAEAHRRRLATLVELRRYDEVLRSSEIALARGEPTADLYLLRGLARAGKQDFVGAIEDYTQALALEPDSAALLRYRGWAFLVTRAYVLALRDFDKSLKLDPDNGDAYSGRSFARASLGQEEQGVADAFKSLKLGGRSQRLLYNAARSLAQASLGAKLNAQPGDAQALKLARQYQEVACSLLAEALEKVSPDQRAAYWRDVVDKDKTLAPLHRLAPFERLVGKYDPGARQRGGR